MPSIDTDMNEIEGESGAVARADTLAAFGAGPNTVAVTGGVVGAVVDSVAVVAADSVVVVVFSVC